MSRLVFRNANLLDGESPARPNATLVVEGERIACVAEDVRAAPHDRPRRRSTPC